MRLLPEAPYRLKADAYLERDGCGGMTSGQHPLDPLLLRWVDSFAACHAAIVMRIAPNIEGIG